MFLLTIVFFIAQQRKEQKCTVLCAVNIKSSLSYICHPIDQTAGKYNHHQDLLFFSQNPCYFLAFLGGAKPFDEEQKAKLL